MFCVGLVRRRFSRLLSVCSVARCWVAPRLRRIEEVSWYIARYPLGARSRGGPRNHYWRHSRNAGRGAGRCHQSEYLWKTVGHAYCRTGQTGCGELELRRVVTVSSPLLWVTGAGCARVQRKGRFPRVECQELHCRGSHASCTLSRVPSKLHTMSGSTQGGWGVVPRSTPSWVPRKQLYIISGPTQVVHYLGPHASCTLSRVPRKLHGGRAKVCATSGPTQTGWWGPRIGNSGMWLGRAPDGSWANPDT